MSQELTDAQVERQDTVDNACYRLVLELTGKDENELPWDIDWIAHVREAVQDVVCLNLQLMSEMEFHPYILPDDEPLYTICKSDIDTCLEEEEIELTPEQYNRLLKAIQDKDFSSDYDEIATTARFVRDGAIE